VVWKLTESRAKLPEAFPDGGIWCDFYAGHGAHGCHVQAENRRSRLSN